MKKIFFASVIASLALTGQAYAAGTGTLTGSGQVTNTACDWINTNVSVALSNGVVAAYDCATSATSIIHIGTASQRGTTKNRTMSCAVNAGGTACNGTTGCTFTPASDDGTTAASCSGNFQVTGNTLFSASTNGGSVSSGEVGTTCDTATAQAQACATAVLSAVTAGITQ